MTKERQRVIDLVSQGFKIGDDVYDKAWKEYTDTFPLVTKDMKTEIIRVLRPTDDRIDRQDHNLR